MKCSNCDATEQEETFCTNCGKPISEELISSLETLKSAKTKKRRKIALWAAASISALILVAYFGRAPIISSLSELYPFGEYRALLAECPGSGLSIYWEPIDVQGSSSQHLTKGASIAFNQATYVLFFENSEEVRAVFALSQTNDVLGCG